MAQGLAPVHSADKVFQAAAGWQPLLQLFVASLLQRHGGIGLLRAQQRVGTDGNHLMKSAALYPYPCR
jgi:hypothetical protein